MEKTLRCSNTSGRRATLKASPRLLTGLEQGFRDRSAGACCGRKRTAAMPRSNCCLWRRRARELLRAVFLFTVALQLCSDLSVATPSHSEKGGHPGVLDQTGHRRSTNRSGKGQWKLVQTPRGWKQVFVSQDSEQDRVSRHQAIGIHSARAGRNRATSNTLHAAENSSSSLRVRNDSSYIATSLVAFVRVPKSGSTAMLKFMRLSGLTASPDFIQSATVLRCALDGVKAKQWKNLWDLPHCIFGRRVEGLFLHRDSRDPPDPFSLDEHDPVKRPNVPFMSRCPHFTYRDFLSRWNAVIGDAVQRKTGVSLQVFSMIREPFPRLRSLFNFVRQWCNTTQEWKGIFSVDQYARLCAGDFGGWLQLLHSMTRKRKFVSVDIPYQFRMFWGPTVDKALALIEGKEPPVLILIQECFEESLRLWEHKFAPFSGAADRFLTSAKVNENTRFPTHREGDSYNSWRSTAEEWFSDDVKFYAAAVKQFWEQMAVAGLHKSMMRNPCAGWDIAPLGNETRNTNKGRNTAPDGRKPKDTGAVGGTGRGSQGMWEDVKRARRENRTETTELQALLAWTKGGGEGKTASESLGNNVHILFTTECTKYLDWQSLGLFTSWRALGHAGRVTRLAACTARQEAAIPATVRNAMPTFFHPNYRAPEELPFSWRVREHSASYNKPGSLKHFLAEASAKQRGSEDFIVFMDADMLLVRPLDPVALGARLGHVVSQRAFYLERGIELGLVGQFLRPEEIRAPPAPVGYVHIMHVRDAAAVAPLWFHYCEELRLHPERYLASLGQVERDFYPGNSTATGQVKAPWVIEMYAYVMAASKLGLTHTVLTDAVAGPSAGKAARPLVIHYTWSCSVTSRETQQVFRLSKRHHPLPSLTDCDAYRRAEQEREGQPFLLPEPRWDEVRPQEFWCAWTIKAINRGLREWFVPGGPAGCPLAAG